MLEKGADPDKETSAGYTPLIEATRANCANAIRSLLKANVALDRETCRGETALMVAATGCKPLLIDLLVESGANVNHEN
eukprot:4093313-Pyramimonas_sp.AAC.1